MKILKNLSGSKAAALAAGAILTTLSVTANTAESTDDWQFGLKIYAWLPTISGELLYPQPEGGNVEADAGKIIDNLKMTFMGSFEARKGKWSGFTDVLYLNLEGDESKSVIFPDGNTQEIADAEMKLKSWVWTLAGAYSVWQQDKSHLDLFAGARLLALDTDLELSGAGPRQKTHKLSASEDIWTGIIGAKGRIGLNDRWFLPYYIDVGAGSSTSTWQALGGVGYSFNWGDIVLDYRYLEYDQDGNKPVQNLSIKGPELGVVFRW